jgi:hypothetical protein
MSEIAHYWLDDGTEVLFEVDPALGPRPAGPDNDVIGTVRRAAEPAVAAARTVLSMLEDAKPDEAEVTFSVKASGTLNWVVAKAATEGTLQIRLLWKSGTSDAAPASVE